MSAKQAAARKNTIFAASLVCGAILARFLSKNDVMVVFFGLIRSLLYIALYFSWGISIYRRVIQPQARRCLLAVSELMVFWFVVRCCKYFFAVTPTVTRLLWYAYYVPMLLIPMLSVFVAMLLDKSEHYRLPHSVRLLIVPTLLCSLFVLTNDLHQLVFSFPADAVWTDANRTVECGYILVFAWPILCAILALAVLKRKSRQSHLQTRLPFLILLCSIVYALIYATGVRWMQVLAGDLTAAQCLLFAICLESCLQTGLIPMNTGYDSLLHDLSVGMQITDAEHHVRYASAAAKPLTAEKMIQVEREGQLLDQTTLLQAYPIPGGCTIWQEDVSDLLRVKNELDGIKEELEERNAILRDQYRKDAQRYKLEEQNRLYDLVQRETQPQLREIDALAEQYTQTRPDTPEQRALLLRILVLSTYIKRHKDMVISSDRSRAVPVHLLEGALRESCSNLATGGIAGNLFIPRTEAMIPVQTALEAYDLFEAALERSLDTLQEYLIAVSEEDDTLQLHINLVCGADLSALQESFPDSTAEQDEDSWFITRTLCTGGNRT